MKIECDHIKDGQCQKFRKGICAISPDIVCKYARVAKPKEQPKQV